MGWDGFWGGRSFVIHPVILCDPVMEVKHDKHMASGFQITKFGFIELDDGKILTGKPYIWW